MRWFTPGAWGFVIGGILTMVVGFSWGGWMRSGTADRIATERASSAVTAALVPVCLEKAKADPARAEKLGELKAFTSSYDQRDAVVKDGWATFGGDPNRDVAEACASHLVNVATK